jgi:hypothetical protein
VGCEKARFRCLSFDLSFTAATNCAVVATSVEAPADLRGFSLSISNLESRSMLDANANANADTDATGTSRTPHCFHPHKERKQKKKRVSRVCGALSSVLTAMPCTVFRLVQLQTRVQLRSFAAKANAPTASAPRSTGGGSRAAGAPQSATAQKKPYGADEALSIAAPAGGRSRSKGEFDDAFDDDAFPAASSRGSKQSGGGGGKRLRAFGDGNDETDGRDPNATPSEAELVTWRAPALRRLTALNAFVSKHDQIRAKLAQLRLKSYAKRKIEFAERRERRRAATANVPRPTDAQLTTRRTAALVLQQVPWFSLAERRRHMLRTVAFLARPKSAVSDTALRLFERKTK